MIKYRQVIDNCFHYWGYIDECFIGPITNQIPKPVNCQFTGLHDVNGVEIYEGDIVVKPDQYIWFDDGEPNYVGIVEMTFSAWSAVAHCVNPEKHGISNGMNFELNESGFADGENTDWQIIGNIYQNPELLK